MTIEDKRVKLEESVESIKSGSKVAIGGFSLNNSPMSIIREIIRQNITELTIIGALPLGIQVDMLVGAGVVKKLICPAVGMESFGTAPNVIRACEKRDIEVVPCDIGYTTYGLRAAAENIPFYPYPLNVLEDTSLIRLNTNYRKIHDPFENIDVIIVPPLKPDVALLHIQSTDMSGNGVHSGSRAADDLLAEAAQTTIITTDEIVPLEWLRNQPGITTMLRHFVDKIIELPFATHPCASHGMYKVDEQHFKHYLSSAQNKENFQKYLIKFIFEPKNHFGYLRSVGGKEYLERLKL